MHMHKYKKKRHTTIIANHKDHTCRIIIIDYEYIEKVGGGDRRAEGVARGVGDRVRALKGDSTVHMSFARQLISLCGVGVHAVQI